MDAASIEVSRIRRAIAGDAAARRGHAAPGRACVADELWRERAGTAATAWTKHGADARRARQVWGDNDDGDTDIHAGHDINDGQKMLNTINKAVHHSQRLGAELRYDCCLLCLREHTTRSDGDWKTAKLYILQRTTPTQHNIKDIRTNTTGI